MSNLHSSDAALKAQRAVKEHKLPGRVVLVLQGGGALGAYQVGVFEALHDAGIEPEWVIGTSIGAINGALIAGNQPEDRVTRLLSFWEQVEQTPFASGAFDAFGMGNALNNMTTVLRGIPSFFTPNPQALLGGSASVGVEKAAYYCTAPLRRTLGELVDFGQVNDKRSTRLTVGAVNVNSGVMTYFDSNKTRIEADHVMASGSLPPAFGAIRIDGEPYWDGGIYSNTPIEAVLDDNPRKDSLIFAVNVWHQTGDEPHSINEVLARQKDIQFASRADSHIAKQKQIHRLRHVIRELSKEMTPAKAANAHIKELTAWGCGTTVHVAHLVAPRISGEDQSKDIDFSTAGITARREAGYADTLRMIERSPWQGEWDPIEGVIEHV
jgi:NTE family protein